MPALFRKKLNSVLLQKHLAKKRLNTERERLGVAIAVAKELAKEGNEAGAKRVVLKGEKKHNGIIESFEKNHEKQKFYSINAGNQRKVGAKGKTRVIVGTTRALISKNPITNVKRVLRISKPKKKRYIL
ncbi:MAG: hypothetical protein WC821_03025 [archaeon]|jgi:hypothetical protein